MKINKYTFILPILFCIIIYLVGVFMAFNFNPANWDNLGRYVTELLFVIAIILGILVSQDVKK